MTKTTTTIYKEGETGRGGFPRPPVNRRADCPAYRAASEPQEKIMEPLGSPPTQPGSPAHIEEPALRTVASLADLPLRRGKWTPEEQNFSEVLIQAFLAGLVPDCADGTTLRAFLSRRLHCAPMRITKKFAGATLGKSIFSRTGQLDAGDAANLRRSAAGVCLCPPRSAIDATPILIPT